MAEKAEKNVRAAKKVGMEEPEECVKVEKKKKHHHHHTHRHGHHHRRQLREDEQKSKDFEEEVSLLCRVFLFVCDWDNSKTKVRTSRKGPVKSKRTK